MSANLALEWWRPDSSAAAYGRLADSCRARVRRARTTARGGFAFKAFLVFTFILVIAPQEFVPALAYLRPAFLAGALAGIGCLWQRSHAERRDTPPRTPMILAGLLLLWSIVTVPFSYWPGGSVSTLLDLYIKALIAFWLIGWAVNETSRLRTLIWMLSVFTIPVAITGLRHYSVGALVEGSGARIQGYGRGLAANPNDLALTLDIIIPLTLALLFTARRWSTRAAALGILLLDVAAVVSTFSRGGFLGLLVVGLLTFAWLIKRRAFGLCGVTVFAAMLAVPLLPPAYLDRLATISDYESDPTGSAQERWRDMALAGGFIAAHPIVGAGLGQDYLALNQLRGMTWRSVHNAYLNYAVDLGLPGLALFVALLVTSIRMASAVERRACAVRSRDELPVFAHGVRIALVTFAVAAVFYPVAYHFYFYYLAGLAVAVYGIAHRTSPAIRQDA